MGGPRGPEGPTKQPPRPVDTGAIALPGTEINVNDPAGTKKPATTTPAGTAKTGGYQTQGKGLGDVVAGSRGPDGKVEKPVAPPVRAGDTVPGTEMRKIVVGKYPPFSGYLVTNDTEASRSHVNFMGGGYVPVTLPEGQTVYVPRENLSFFRGHLAQKAVDIWPHEPTKPTAMAYGVNRDNTPARTAQKPQPQPSRGGTFNFNNEPMVIRAGEKDAPVDSKMSPRQRAKFEAFRAAFGEVNKILQRPVQPSKPKAFGK